VILTRDVVWSLRKEYRLSIPIYSSHAMELGLDPRVPPKATAGMLDLMESGFAGDVESESRHERLTREGEQPLDGEESSRYAKTKPVMGLWGLKGGSSCRKGLGEEVMVLILPV
jgi:hypothetical protein